MRDSKKKTVLHEGSFNMQKIKYTAEEKKAIVEAWLNGTERVTDLKKNSGVSDGRLREWILQYKANGVKAFILQRQNNVYSEEIKLKAVTDYVHIGHISVKNSLRFGD
ncbi:MAG: transposase [Stomatobaculum sp.]|nr:transposase [Stomatobaculum sp.]